MDCGDLLRFQLLLPPSDAGGPDEPAGPFALLGDPLVGVPVDGLAQRGRLAGQPQRSGEAAHLTEGVGAQPLVSEFVVAVAGDCLELGEQAGDTLEPLDGLPHHPAPVELLREALVHPGTGLAGVDEGGDHVAGVAQHEDDPGPGHGLEDQGGHHGAVRLLDGQAGVAPGGPALAGYHVHEEGVEGGPPVRLLGVRHPEGGVFETPRLVLPKRVGEHQELPQVGLVPQLHPEAIGEELREPRGARSGMAEDPHDAVLGEAAARGGGERQGGAFRHGGRWAGRTWDGGSLVPRLGNPPGVGRGAAWRGPSSTLCP